MLTEESARVNDQLLRLPLGQPLLTAALSFAQFRFLSDARLFIETATLQFAEQTFACQLLLGNLQSFFNVVIENFNFHPVRLSTFSGRACLHP